MSKEFILEIGMEEIPSRFIGPALDKMRELCAAMLANGRVGYRSDIKVYGTPRRLILHIAELDAQQADISKDVVGPPRKVAFDAEGRPTKAALVFAEKNGISVDALTFKTTEKGEYVAARFDEKGGETLSWLRQSLAGFILSLPFPKTMRWMDKDIRFARPIHWIAALYAGEPVSFEVGGIKSGALSRGHRFMSPGAFLIKDFKSFVQQAERNFVVLDPEVRKHRILKQIQDLAGTVNGTVLADEGLVDEVANLVEYPVAVIGSFQKEYLRVPKEVLVTAMREHQRYFSVIDMNGNLLPYFITISNTQAENMDVVRSGNERVLAARLSDAAYFFDHDLKQPLAVFAEGLKKVTYQEKLGSIHDKTVRTTSTAGRLAGIFGADKTVCERAAALSKADLLTGVVGEFPKLQGIMGKYYAIESGEDKRVASAIVEHYQPKFAGDVLPGTLEGVCVGIADRIDTIVGCFSVGLIPSGSEDPYGLRRQSVAIMSMLLDRGLRLSLRELVLGACKEYRLESAVSATIAADVLDFLRQRLSGMLITEGLRADVIDAALSVNFDDVILGREKVRALDALRASEDYLPLVTALKRAGNILPKDFSGSVREQLLQHDAEKALYAALVEVKDRVASKTEQLDFRGALAEIALLRRPVDAFFDNVMVMDKNELVKENRLSLLAGITTLFSRIADFSRLDLSLEEKNTK